MTLSMRQNFGIWLHIMPAVGTAAVEHGDCVPEHRKVARDRERSRPRTDPRDAPAVLRGRLRQPRADVVLEVGHDALQPSDRDRLGIDAPATAGRLAGTVAHAAEDPPGTRSTTS